MSWLGVVAGVGGIGALVSVLVLGVGIGFGRGSSRVLGFATRASVAASCVILVLAFVHVCSCRS